MMSLEYISEKSCILSPEKEKMFTILLVKEKSNTIFYHQIYYSLFSVVFALDVNFTYNTFKK